MAVGLKLGFWDLVFLNLGFWDFEILKLGFWDPYPPYAPLSYIGVKNKLTRNRYEKHIFPVQGERKLKKATRFSPHKR